MYTQPSLSLTELNLANYEILNNEPLHDISNHIKNIYAELPHHLSKSLKSLVEEIIQASFNNKEAKNSI